MNKALALALLLPLAAHAQTATTAPNLIPVTGTVETNTVEAPPASTSVSSPAPATTAAPIATPVTLKAVLDVPRSAYGELNVKLTLSNLGPNSAMLVASRDSRQDCAFGPLLRVLKVGTREVVYPTQDSPRICTQDALNTDLGKDKSLTLTHKLRLEPGEYMLEGWFQGGVNGVARQVAAEPVRLTVR